MEHIKIEGHRGTWYSIDEMKSKQFGDIYLMESEQYGDEASCIIVDKELHVLLDDVEDGFDQYLETYNDDRVISLRESIVRNMIKDYLKDIKDDGYLTCSRQHYEKYILTIDLQQAEDELYAKVINEIPLETLKVTTFMYIGKIVDKIFNAYCEKMGLI